MKRRAVCCFIANFFIFVLFSNIIVQAVAFNIDFDTTSESISLINLDLNTVVYEKNPNQRRGPASVTKIMTYIVAVENVPDLKGTVVNVKDETLDSLLGTGSSLSGLRAGDRLTVYELLHCLMIPSGNDAALVLADYVGSGDISNFVSLMNQKAEELGCANTHFMNPHGLPEYNHYTTSNDMANIVKYAMTLPYFSEITNQVVSTIIGEDRPLVTTNRLIDKVRGGDYYYKYAKGIKTGHADETTGYCLVSTAANDGYTYLCVALGAPNDGGAEIDSKNLYRWAFNSLEIKQIMNSETPIGEVKVKYAWNKDSMMLTTQGSLSTILPVSVSSSSIEVITDIPDSVNAPISAGQKIGTATLRYANQDLETVDLLASEDIPINYFIFFIDIINALATSKWFIISIVIVLVLLVVYILLATRYNKIKKIKKRNEISRKYQRRR